jgi:transcriptional regulator with XRE-family HTH domain
VRLLLDTHFGGNQTQAAERLGVSQSLVNKIVRGQRTPGRKLLEKLARLAGVNPDWVLHGRGQPLLPPTKGTLPVSPGLLPGPPGRHADLLTGERHPVAEPFERESRYWMQLHALSPLLHVTAWGILPNDLLLMETSSDLTTRLDLVVGRLCGVRLERQSGTTFEVGRVERVGTGIVLMLDKVIGKLIEPPPPPAPHAPHPFPPPTEQPPKRRIINLAREAAVAEERRRRQEEREEEERRQQEQLRQEREQGLGYFTAGDIVAVCLYLARPTPGLAPVLVDRGNNG